MLNTYEIYWMGFRASWGTIGPQYPFRWMPPPPPEGYKKVDQGQMLTEVLENTPHYFVFILSPSQIDEFSDYYQKYGWNRFLHHKSKGALWNPNYTKKAGYSPRLFVYVLKGIGSDEA